MLNDHDQCMSLKKLIRSASFDSGFLSNAIASIIGTRPRTENNIIPGSKKLLNGELCNIDKGIPINFPLGEIIKTPPPPIAPNPRNANKAMSKFLVAFDFIIIYFELFLIPPFFLFLSYTYSS